MRHYIFILSTKGLNALLLISAYTTSYLGKTSSLIKSVGGMSPCAKYNVQTHHSTYFKPAHSTGSVFLAGYAAITISKK